MALFRRRVPVDPLDRLEIPPPASLRRGLFIMLLVLGVFAAAAFFAARNAAVDAAEARDQARVASQERSVLIRRVDEVLAQAQSAQSRAEQQRGALEERTRALETLLIALLADSDDPEVREAFKELIAGRPSSPDSPTASDGPRASRGSSAPAPSSQPSTAPPSPRPGPSEPPPASPMPLACVLLVGVEVCTP